jgi:hypothetical protein
MSATAFREELAHGGKLVDLMMRYAQMRMVEMSQTILCNRFHGIVERTARWLMQLNERVEEVPFELTQQFFATMLGANRPNVTEAAHALRERGLIDYSPGTIDVLDADGLEAASCDCYRIVRDELDRLLETGRAAARDRSRRSDVIESRAGVGPRRGSTRARRAWLPAPRPTPEVVHWKHIRGTFPAFPVSGRTAEPIPPASTLEEAPPQQ